MYIPTSAITDTLWRGTTTPFCIWRTSMVHNGNYGVLGRSMRECPRQVSVSLFAPESHEKLTWRTLRLSLAVVAMNCTLPHPAGELPLHGQSRPKAGGYTGANFAGGPSNEYHRGRGRQKQPATRFCTSLSSFLPRRVRVMINPAPVESPRGDAE